MARFLDLRHTIDDKISKKREFMRMSHEANAFPHIRERQRRGIAIYHCVGRILGILLCKNMPDRLPIVEGIVYSADMAATTEGVDSLEYEYVER